MGQLTSLRLVQHHEGAPEQELIAVRTCLGDAAGARHATRAPRILEDHRLTEQIREHRSEYTPDAVAERCGLTADRIRRLANEIADIAFNHTITLNVPWTDTLGRRHETMVGRPIAFHLTPGEAADCKAYDTLIELPEQTPDALLADKAYDTDAIRADLKERGIKPVIPPKSNRIATIRYNKTLYRERNCIERVLGHLKINRAIATRYDQLAESFLGMLFIASARYWIKFVHAT